MRYQTGDLFTSTCEALGHGVNVKGLMGAGIAKTFKEKYEDNYLVYGMMCKTKQLVPGGTLIVPAYEKNFLESDEPEVRYIANMATQNRPGADASYKWVLESTLATARQFLTLGIDSCAIPEIASNIGGLEWDRVEGVLYAVEDICDGKFEWEVWHYDPTV